MRRSVAVPGALLLCPLAWMLSGCQRPSAPDGLTLLARSHGAEETLCYSVREVNEQVMMGPWAPSGASLSASGPARPVMALASLPVTTFVARTECGPDQERVEVLSNPGEGSEPNMVRVRRGDRIFRYSPAQRRLDLTSMPPTDMGPLNWYALILNNYTVEGVRRDRVANLPAWYLEVRPKHPGRPLKRLWLDADTYLPLRQELWGADGVLISATQALSAPVLLSAPNPADFVPPVLPQDPTVTLVRGDEDRAMADGPLAATLGFPLGRMTDLPDGFRLVGEYLHDCPHLFGRCARWELTDGIASVSVIQTRVNTDALHEMESPEDVQGNIETARRGAFHFLVRGNLASSELRRIADGIVLQARPASGAPVPPAR